MTRGLKRNFLFSSLMATIVVMAVSSSSSRCHNYVGIRCLATAFASSSQPYYYTRSSSKKHRRVQQQPPLLTSSILGRTGDNVNHRRCWIHLHQRGGACFIDNNNNNNNNSLYASTRPVETSTTIQDAGGGGGSSSSSSSSGGRSDSNNHKSSTSLLHEKATEAMSIAGKSTSLKSFGGLTYRDALAEEERFRVLFVLGGPGAGKGTQCELLKQNYPCVHLSAGQLLREEAQKKDTSEHAALIEECLVAGKIVPVEISLSLLQNAMRDADGQSLLFLVDGFPRNFDNLEGWTRCMTQDLDPASVWGTLVYHCPLPTLEKRVMERSKDSGRSDDNLESLRRRFSTFQSETVPVVNTLRLIEENSLLKVVDIKGEQSLEQVWEDTQKAMNNFLTNDILSANVRLLAAVATKDVDTYRTLCADEMFDGESSMSVADIMLAQEGSDHLFTTINVKCAELTFVTGTKVSVRYDRTSDSGTTFRETRVWSHQGSKGWRMVHFSRTA